MQSISEIPLFVNRQFKIAASAHPTPARKPRWIAEMERQASEYADLRNQGYSDAQACAIVDGPLEETA